MKRSWVKQWVWTWKTADAMYSCGCWLSSLGLYKMVSKFENNCSLALQVPRSTSTVLLEDTCFRKCRLKTKSSSACALLPGQPQSPHAVEPVGQSHHWVYSVLKHYHGRCGDVIHLKGSQVLLLLQANNWEVKTAASLQFLDSLLMSLLSSNHAMPFRPCLSQRWFAKWHRQGWPIFHIPALGQWVILIYPQLPPCAKEADHPCIMTLSLRGRPSAASRWQTVYVCVLKHWNDIHRGAIKALLACAWEIKKLCKHFKVLQPWIDCSRMDLWKPL